MSLKTQWSQILPKLMKWSFSRLKWVHKYQILACSLIVDTGLVFYKWSVEAWISSSQCDELHSSFILLSVLVWVTGLDCSRPLKDVKHSGLVWELWDTGTIDRMRLILPAALCLKLHVLFQTHSLCSLSMTFDLLLHWKCSQFGCDYQHLEEFCRRRSRWTRKSDSL